MTAIKKKDEGVTLIELMIVLFIASFLVAGIYSLFITQHRSYTVQDQVVGVQQDARVALDLMARDIRMAGFVAGAGSGTGFTDGLINSITLPGAITYAITPVNSTSAPDSITVVLGTQELGVVQTVTVNVVQVDRSAPSNPTFNYFSFDLLPGRLYQGTFTGTNISISSTGFPSGSSKIVGGKAYGVQAITYGVSNGVLQRVGQPLAGDGINTIVEDLQFAYQVQGDTANWYNTPVAAGATNADIRMVRINIIVKTAVPDPKETSFFKPACEDHGQDNSDPGNRRRVYTTEVKVRNL